MLPMPAGLTPLAVTWRAFVIALGLLAALPARRLAGS
jgi:hypothetical protein